MNHFNSKVGYFFLIVAMLITFSACKDDSVSVGGGDGIFSTSLKTAFVGAKPSDEFITHFEQIFTQKQSAIDNNTKVVVIYNRLSMLSVSDKEAIKRVYDADGAIVCVNPHMRDLSEFRDYLGHEMGGVVVGHDNQFCEFYAFNRWGNCYTQAYFIPEEGVAYTTTEESEDASNPEYNKGGTGDFTLKNITWEAAEYKSAMKPFGEWLTECVVTNRTSKQKMRNQLTDGELSLGDLNTNISHIYTFPVSVNVTTYSGESLNKNTTVTVKSVIIPCYNSGGNGTDYYIVNDEINVPNGSMYKGKWSKYVFPIEWKECALWNSDFKVSSVIYKDLAGNNLAGGASISKPYPQTVNNVTSVTTGMSWNIGGKVSVEGIGETPKGSVEVNGGVSFSNSKTFSMSDFSGHYTGNGLNTAGWDFTATKQKPGYYDTYPAGLSTSTALYYTGWIWQIDNSKNNATTPNANFVMAKSIEITYSETAFWGLAGSGKYWFKTVKPPTQYWELPHPDR